jgi:hypothetical protein
MLHLLNLKSQSFEMAEKSGFEALKTRSALLKKWTFAEKVEQRAVIKFCVDIGKTPTETHKFLKQSEKHRFAKIWCAVVLEIAHLSATSRTVSRRSPLITSRTSFFTASDSLKDGLPSRSSSANCLFRPQTFCAT